MGLTEQELRDHLSTAAAQAAEPRLALEDITTRIRRQRGRIAVIAAAGLAAVLTLAVTLPMTLGGGKPAGLTAAPSLAPSLHFKVSANGHHRYHRAHTFSVRPGESLMIDVELTVPEHVTISHLWLGISTGTYGFTRAKGTYGNAGIRPIGIRQMLASTATGLSAGRHTFQLRWTVPESQATKVQLAGDWAFTMQGPPFEGDVAELIAQFAIVD